jgi:hypothetical protein
MLRAFNGECDAALSKVRWDNIQKMEERVKKSVETMCPFGKSAKFPDWNLINCQPS